MSRHPEEFCQAVKGPDQRAVLSSVAPSQGGELDDISINFCSLLARASSSGLAYLTLRRQRSTQRRA